MEYIHKKGQKQDRNAGVDRFGLIPDLPAKEVVRVWDRGYALPDFGIEAYFPICPGSDPAHQEDIVAAQDMADGLEPAHAVEGGPAIGQVASRTGQREADAGAAGGQGRDDEALQGQQAL